MAQDKLTEKERNEVEHKIFIEAMESFFRVQAIQDDRQFYYQSLLNKIIELIPGKDIATRKAVLNQILSGSIEAQLHSETKVVVWLNMALNSLRNGTTVLQVLMLLDSYCV